MNKNITNLCIDLQEGKINRKDFLREARRNFPHLITNTNSFNDIIKIFKNKNIISEGCNCESQINEIRPYEDEEDELYSKQSAIKPQFDKIPTPAEPDEQDLEILKNLDLLDKENIDSEFMDDEEFMNDDEWDDDFGEFGELTENKKLTINEVDPYELQIGMRVEREHTPDLDKRIKIALDHLSEDPRYYTKLNMAGLDDSKIEKPNKKRTDLPTEVDKKMSNMIDKANQMVSPKNITKDKASANKAHKETVTGVKGVKDLTHKAIRAKGIKGVMDMTGGKMKKVKGLNESELKQKMAKQKEENINQIVHKHVHKLIKSKFPNNYSNIKLSENKNSVNLNYNNENQLPKEIFNLIKEHFNINSKNNNNKYYYEISPKINTEMLNEIKKRIKNLFK